MADEESDYDDESEYSDSDEELVDDDELDNDEEANKDGEDDEMGTGSKGDPRLKRMKLAKCLPYEVETLEEMDAKLEYIITKLTVSIEAQDWEFGFRTWLSRLNK
jgi:proteasome activator subunit 4